MNSIQVAQIALWVLVPAIAFLLGALVSNCLREFKPQWERSFSLLYLGFLCGVLVCGAVLLFMPNTPRFLGWGDSSMVAIGTKKSGFELAVGLFGVVLIAFNMLILFSVWLFPKLLEISILKWFRSGGRVELSRKNIIIVGGFQIFILAGLVTEHLPSKWFLLACAMPFFITLMRIPLRRQTQ